MNKTICNFEIKKSFLSHFFKCYENKRYSLYENNKKRKKKQEDYSEYKNDK